MIYVCKQNAAWYFQTCESYAIWSELVKNPMTCGKLSMWIAKVRPIWFFSLQVTTKNPGLSWASSCCCCCCCCCCCWLLVVGGCLLLPKVHLQMKPPSAGWGRRDANCPNGPNRLNQPWFGARCEYPSEGTLLRKRPYWGLTTIHGFPLTRPWPQTIISEGGEVDQSSVIISAPLRLLSLQ